MNFNKIDFPFGWSNIEFECEGL